MVSPEYLDDQVSQDAATLRQSLHIDLREYPGPVTEDAHLLVLSGLPGTGKSHFARELVKRVPLVVLGSDRCRKALLARPQYTREEHVRVFAACHRLIQELLTEGYSLVFDATNLTERSRQPLYEIAGRTKATLVVVWFTAPPDLVRRRLAERSAGLNDDGYSDADWEIYCRLRPGEEAVRTPHMLVDSSTDMTHPLEVLAQRLKSPGRGVS